MRKSILPLFLIAALAGCTSLDSSPLIFGQGLTVGISAGPSATNAASPEIVIGLKMADVAIVPTVIPKDVELGTKDTSRKIAAHGQGANGLQDALSTFGSFSTNTKVNEVTLGVFFATGVAAQKLAEGFRCAVAAGQAIKPTNCPD